MHTMKFSHFVKLSEFWYIESYLHFPQLRMFPLEPVVMHSRVKPWPAAIASHMDTGSGPVAPLPIQLPTNVPEKSSKK